MVQTGFGFLRLPLKNPQDESSVDMQRVFKLVDRFMELGGSYFDTAYTYHGEQSERILREAVIRRYPRERLHIADKLPGWKMKTRRDCDACFDEQLHRCGVDYFDVYLLHGLDAENYAVCKEYGGFDFLAEKKASGRVKATGFSYHDSPELLDEILTAHPEIDLVQLQINYLDWNSASIQARRCWEIACRHRKRIIVMEPVKGGSLASLPEAAEKLLKAADPGRSMAAWALDFVRSLPGVEVVLSGMNDLAQIEDNLQNRPVLTRTQLRTLEEAAEIIRSNTAIGCTGCGYCLSGCPKKIAIPCYFKLYNEYMRSPRERWKMDYAYNALAANAKASDCLGCGACERSCPQKLGVIQGLRAAVQAFETRKED